MVRYLLRRAGLSLVTLFLFVTFLFFLAQVLIPGDFATQFRIGLSDVQFRELRQELAIDRPLWDQYLDWMGSLARPMESQLCRHPASCRVRGRRFMALLGGLRLPRVTPSYSSFGDASSENGQRPP